MAPKCRQVVARGFLFCSLAAVAAGCRTADDNFSRVLNEPAPLAPEVRASFGKVGLLPADWTARSVPFPKPTPEADLSGVEVRGQARPTIGITLAQSTGPELRDSDRTHARHPGSTANDNQSAHQDHRPPDGQPHNSTPPGGSNLTAKSPSDRTSDSKTPTGSSGWQHAHEHEWGHSGASAYSSRGDHNAGPAGDIAADAIGEILRAGPVDDVAADSMGEILLSVLVDAPAAILQAWTEHTEEKGLEKGHAALRQVAQDDPLRNGFHERIEQLAAKGHCDALLPVPQAVLAACSSPSSTNEVGHVLQGAGIDSVLQVDVRGERFILSGIHSMTFAADARVRVVRVEDGLTLHDVTLLFQSGTRPFDDWKNHNARHLRDEMRTAQKLLAESVVQQLFALETRR